MTQDEIKKDAESLVRDLRKRINPAYQDQLGTESHERKNCADMIDALLSLQQWRPIEEAPKDGTGILVFFGMYKPEVFASGFINPIDEYATVYWCDEISGWVGPDGSEVEEPRFFMPLPPAPEGV